MVKLERCAQCDRREVTYKLIFLSRDIRDIHIMGRGAKFFQLFSGENVNRNKMDLGVTMFSSLRGGHVDNLARTVLDDNESVLSQGRALHRVRSRRARIGGVKGVFMLQETNG